MWDTEVPAPILEQYTFSFPKVIASYLTTRQYFKEVILDLENIFFSVGHFYKNSKSFMEIYDRMNIKSGGENKSTIDL